MVRTYFVFKIKNEFIEMYLNKPYRIYKMLEEIYRTKKYDIAVTYNLFNDICVFLNKNTINEYIYNSYKNDKKYRYSNYNHTYITNEEVSKISINNSNIKIVTNVNYPIFLKDINIVAKNIFICDFVNKDYFILNEIKNKL